MVDLFAPTDISDKGSRVSNIPNVLKGQNVLVATGYGTAATNQSETSKILTIAGAGYEEIYTVPAGKTWYVTAYIISDLSGATILIATGAGGSETDIFAVTSAAPIVHQLALTTPMKFTAGTRVSGKDGVSGSNITLIGWEE